MEDIKELIPGVEDGKIKIKQHPKERITEKTIKGIWKAANSKVTITFKIGKPGSVLKVATSILKKNSYRYYPNGQIITRLNMGGEKKGNIEILFHLILMMTHLT